MNKKIAIRSFMCKGGTLPSYCVVCWSNIDRGEWESRAMCVCNIFDYNKMQQIMCTVRTPLTQHSLMNVSLNGFLENILVTSASNLEQGLQNAPRTASIFHQFSYPTYE